MKFLGNLTFKSIGSDPEFFIVKNNQALPSCMFVQAMKNNSIKSPFKIFKDNLLIEGNIPPSCSIKGFINNMETLKGMMKNRIQKKEAQLISTDAMKFAPRFLTLPDASDFGCSNYFDAWDDIKNVLTIPKSHPTPKFRSNLRTAGFHIHLGLAYEGTYQDINSQQTKSLKDLTNTALEKVIKFHINRVIVKIFDLLVTNTSRHIHVHQERAKGYGSFGAFRNTPYGLECRSLGGYFTQKKYLWWVAEQSIRAISHTSFLIKKNPEALIHFSKDVNLETINNLFIKPELYKKFHLDYNQEINKINEIEKIDICTNNQLTKVNINETTHEKASKNMY